MGVKCLALNFFFRNTKQPLFTICIEIDFMQVSLWHYGCGFKDKLYCDIRFAENDKFLI